MKTRGILCVILFLTEACVSGIVHVQVVDTDGNPVVGARSEILYYRDPLELFGSPIPFKVREKSDEEGRFLLPIPIGCSLGWIGDPSRQGYRFEQHCNRESPHDLDPAQYTHENPFRLIMYKVPDERADLLWFKMEKKRRIAARDVDARFDVDLFESCLGAEYGDRRKPHIDFSVVVHFDEVARRWKIAFETSNADTGLLATTNRVYRAPTAGYARRVEVPQEMYADRSFTLYLYTRRPRVYAMLVFASGDLEYETDQWAHLTFSCSSVRINPHGGTLMEGYDPRLILDGTFDGVGTREVTCLLEEHRYPPLPDMKARLENRRRWRALEAEEDAYSKEIGVHAERRKLLREKLAKKADSDVNRELRRVQKEIDDLKKKRTRNILARHRLDDEIVGMFLPEGQAATNAVKKLSPPTSPR